MNTKKLERTCYMVANVCRSEYSDLFDGKWKPVQEYPVLSIEDEFKNIPDISWIWSFFDDSNQDIIRYKTFIYDDRNDKHRMINGLVINIENVVPKLYKMRRDGQFLSKDTIEVVPNGEKFYTITTYVNPE